MNDAYRGVPASKAVQNANKHIAVVNALLNVVELPSLPLVTEELLFTPEDLDAYAKVLVDIAEPPSSG